MSIQFYFQKMAIDRFWPIPTSLGNCSWDWDLPGFSSMPGICVMLSCTHWVYTGFEGSWQMMKSNELPRAKQGKWDDYKVVAIMDDDYQ